MLKEFLERLENLFTGELGNRLASLEVQHGILKCEYRDAINQLKDSEFTSVKEQRNAAAWEKEFQRLKSAETTHLARLKILRAVMREHGIEHLYPGANPRIVADHAEGRVIPYAEQPGMRVQMIHTQAQVTHYRKECDLWAEYCEKLQNQLTEAGIAWEPLHRDMVVNDVAMEAIANYALAEQGLPTGDIRATFSSEPEQDDRSPQPKRIEGGSQ